MDKSHRELFCVDLKGMRAALLARARLEGVSPTNLVRRVLVERLGKEEGRDLVPSVRINPVSRGPVRLSLRLSAADAQLIRLAARQARLSPGAYLVGLASEVPSLTGGGGRPALLTELHASTDELVTVRRGLLQLAALLRHGEGEAARAYRDLLLRIEAPIHRHLRLASVALAEAGLGRPGSRAGSSGGAPARGERHE
ncbi:hypothetical protein [Paucibacter sp. XJ19-41]|uniref:hypothetical protein n=1 Tax=Paucibacter sp. XJ19-41 TaxID=2927824 RepID=UPI00234BD8D9|nr:hypothetical protein [Paucibacter sp. XJ19-41]MDC6167815.1 hypothetical protein [Paucibacter sp. XJ19-41]